MAKEEYAPDTSCFGERVLLADTAVLADDVLFEKGLAWITKERRAQITRLKSPADRRRSLGAGLLLELGLRGQALSLLAGVPGKTHVSMRRGAFGKPYLAERQEFFFNLSHAGDYAAAVFADCEAGIDVELKRHVRPGIAERFFTEEECAALLHGEHDFFWFWTRKESYIKAVGEGMHLPLTDFCVLSDKMSGERSYFFKTWEEEEGLFVSVCAERPIVAVPIRVDLRAELAKSI